MHQFKKGSEIDAKQTDWEILYWSEYHSRRGPTDNESRHLPRAAIDLPYPFYNS
jgi:hypothetical protein